MKNLEKHCATWIRLTEGEQFLGVGDARLGPRLNEGFADDRARGKTVSLPDLVSIRSVGPQTVFRVREVKFKLELRLVQKAMRQLREGLDWVNHRFDSPGIDRVELVIALSGRTLKPEEQLFLGKGCGLNRHELLIDSVPQKITSNQVAYAVSVLLI